MKSFSKTIIPLCLLTLASCGSGGNTMSSKNNSTSATPTYTYNEETMYENVWEAKTIYNEPVVMIEDAEGNRYGKLLYTPTKIISVKNYTLEKDYSESEYEVRGNKLYMTSTSTMPYLTQKNISCEEIPDLIGGKYEDGRGGNILFTEGAGIVMYQVNVTYEHNDTWEGFIPPKQGNDLPNLWGKLINKEKINLVINGASTDGGANSSAKLGIEPFQDDWGTGFSKEITRRYGSEVNYHNTSVGGTLSSWGRDNVDSNVNHYNPDLVVLGFGLNDGTWKVTPQEFCDNMEFMIRSIKSNNEDTEIIVISTILPNPASIQGLGIEKQYIEPLKNVCQDYPGVILMDMTSLSEELYKRKTSFELFANNICHPDDFYQRIFVQEILTTIERD